MKLMPALLLTLTLLPLGGCVVAVNSGGWDSDEEDWEERQANNIELIAGLFEDTTVTGTRDVLPAGTSDLLPGSAKLVIHPPISVNGVSAEECQQLMKETREIIASSLPPALRSAG